MRLNRFISVLLPILVVLFSQSAFAGKKAQQVKKQVEPAAQSGLILEIDAGYSGMTLTGLTVGKKFANKDNKVLALGLYGKAAFAMSMANGLYGADLNFLLKFHLNFNKVMVSPFVGAGFGFWGISAYYDPVFAFAILLNAGLSTDWFVTNKFYVGIEGSLDHVIITGRGLGFSGTINPAMALHFGFLF